MKRLLLSLLVAAGTVSTAQAESYRDVPPDEGLPICSAVYGVLSRESTTQENRDYWMKVSWQVAVAGKRYNPNIANDAVMLANEMQGRLKRFEPGYLETFKTTVKNCDKYVKIYGVR